MTNSSTDERISSDWYSAIAPMCSAASVAVFGFVYTAIAVLRLRLPDKQSEVLMFLVGALCLPILCSVAYVICRRSGRYQLQLRVLDATNVWLAAAFLLAIACVPPVLYARQMDISAWFSLSQIVIKLTLIVHVLSLLIGLLFSARLAPVIAQHRTAQSVFFIVAFAACAFSVYRLAPTEPAFNPLTRVFASSHSVSWKVIAVASLAVAGIVLSGWFERRIASQDPSRLPKLRVAALAVSLVLLPLLFFDLSLYGDPGHYFGYLGPALHLRHGGTLMVDTFAQYGPGPTMLVWLATLPGTAQFALMNLEVQIANFVYYALFLICTYRMSTQKFPALLLGLGTIAILLAAWVYGIGNLNSTPSVLAFRYLPVLMTVTAISGLRAPRRVSVGLLLSLAFATIWSIETMVASFGIFAAFTVLVGLKNKDPAAVLRDLLLGLAPVVLVIVVFSLVTFVSSGSWPAYAIYLHFLINQNPVSLYWTTRAAWAFNGWMVPLLAAVLVLSDAMARVMGRSITPLDDEQLFYRFVPMAGLLLFQSTYFVGRSIDFTLLISLLPFAAIAIPALITAWFGYGRIGWRARIVTALPVPILMWGFAFSLAAFANHDSPYRFLVNECRLYDRCSPSRIASFFRERMNKQLVLEKAGLSMGDNWYDKEGIVRDTIQAIRQYGGDKPNATVILGNIDGFDMDIASDIALMYAGKWHTWPRSVAFSDELVPELIDRITEADVRLEAGDLVIVRRDESKFFTIEQRLLKRVRREYELCELPVASQKISVSRISDGSCLKDQL